MSLGKQIKQRREALELSQEQLGEKLGVSFQAVSGWEREASLPETERLTKIAEALKTSVAALVGENSVFSSQNMAGRLFDEERMYTFVKSAAIARNFHQTLKALPYAKEKHTGQFRKGKAQIPYISHPLTMCCHALAMGLDEDNLLAVILLHDVAEDCGVSPEDLPVDDKVRKTVFLLSKDKSHELDEEGYDKGYFEDISKHRHAMLVKLLDRCHNLSVMSDGFTRKRMAEYIEHTETWVMPLADNLRKLAPEYSNACFLLKYQMKSLMQSLSALLIHKTK